MNRFVKRVHVILMYDHSLFHNFEMNLNVIYKNVLIYIQDIYKKKLLLVIPFSNIFDNEIV